MSQSTSITVSQCGTPSQRTKVTNTFANEDKTTVDAPTSRTGLALCSGCHPAWTEGTLVGPGKDTHGAAVPTEWGGRGWPTTSNTRHHQHDKTKITVTRLGYQHVLFFCFFPFFLFFALFHLFFLFFFPLFILPFVLLLKVFLFFSIFLPLSSSLFHCFSLFFLFLFSCFLFSFFVFCFFPLSLIYVFLLFCFPTLHFLIFSFLPSSSSFPFFSPFSPSLSPPSFFTPLLLSLQHGSEAGSSRPQIYDATTELGDKIEEMIVRDRIVHPLYVFVTKEYGWSANVDRIMKAQALRDKSTSSYLMFQEDPGGESSALDEGGSADKSDKT